MERPRIGELYVRRTGDSHVTVDFRIDGDHSTQSVLEQRLHWRGHGKHSTEPSCASWVECADWRDCASGSCAKITFTPATVEEVAELLRWWHPRQRGYSIGEWLHDVNERCDLTIESRRIIAEAAMRVV